MKLNSQFKTLLILPIIFILAGCGLSHVKTTSESLLLSKPLAEDEGLLVLGIKSDSFVQGVYLFGKKSMVIDYKKGNTFDFNRQYWVGKVKAGNYHIVQIDFNGNYFMPLDEREKWSVSVAPQKINYIGDLEIELILANDITFKTELMNRTSYAMEYMERYYPNLFSNHPFEFNGVGVDEFSSFMSKLPE